MPIIECIPNIGEGRRSDVVASIAAAVGRAPGVRVLDVSSDAAHHRSVLTLAGDAAGLKAAILVLFEQTLAAVDLTSHQGEHPRLARWTSCRLSQSTGSRCASARFSGRAPNFSS